MRGVLSDERAGMSFVTVTVSSNKSVGSMYVGYPESKFRWATEKKQELVSKPFILPFDVHTVPYFST
jgi:hypothetical protein